MTDNEVCAIIVTFHPDRDVLDNLAAVRPQVKRLIVVDNGSSHEELELLRAAALCSGFDLIENKDNLGIASALNIGIRHALAQGAVWLLLFDQDSRVTGGFTDTMLRAFQTSAWGDRLAILVPRYTDMRNGSPLPADWAAGGGLETAMTSGTLLHADTIAQHGLFIDDLFIDSVDCEYSLRLRQAGRILDECPSASLLHSPGNPIANALTRVLPFKTGNYSPVRRYYQERNKFWIYRHYLRRFPGYCFKIFIASIKDLLKIALVETDKRKKLAYCLRGISDGLRGRMGKLQA